MNIEVDDNDFRISSQDMRINDGLSTEVKARARALFDKYYANPLRSLTPAVENTMNLISSLIRSQMINRFHVHRADFRTTRKSSYDIF